MSLLHEFNKNMQNMFIKIMNKKIKPIKQI